MRLIDADALANDLLYDVEMDANALDNADLVGIERERIQLDKDCKQNCVYYLTETEPIDAVKVIRCKDCKYYAGEGMYCEQNICVQFDHFYCYYGEREDNHYKMGKMLADNFYNGVSFWRERVDKRCDEICKDYTESEDKE